MEHSEIYIASKGEGGGAGKTKGMTPPFFWAAFILL